MSDSLLRQTARARPRKVPRRLSGTNYARATNTYNLFLVMTVIAVEVHQACCHRSNRSHQVGPESGGEPEGASEAGPSVTPPNEPFPDLKPPPTTDKVRVFDVL